MAEIKEEVIKAAERLNTGTTDFLYSSESDYEPARELHLDNYCAEEDLQLLVNYILGLD